MGLMSTQPDSVDAGGGYEVRKKVDPKDALTPPDLHLTAGNLLALMKAVRVFCNWSQAQRHHEFVFETSMEFGPSKKQITP